MKIVLETYSRLLLPILNHFYLSLSVDRLHLSVLNNSNLFSLAFISSYKGSLARINIKSCAVWTICFHCYERFSLLLKDLNLYSYLSSYALSVSSILRFMYVSVDNSYRQTFESKESPYHFDLLLQVSNISEF